jgi:hypothetical protein
MITATWQLHISSFMDANAISHHTQAAVLKRPAAGHQLHSQQQQPAAAQAITHPKPVAGCQLHHLNSMDVQQ